MKKFYHVESLGSVKGSILTENHADAINFYNDCKEKGAGVVFTFLTEEQADAHKKSVEKKANNVLIGGVQGQA